MVITTEVLGLNSRRPHVETEGTQEGNWETGRLKLNRDKIKKYSQNSTWSFFFFFPFSFIP